MADRSPEPGSTPQPGSSADPARDLDLEFLPLDISSQTEAQLRLLAGAVEHTRDAVEIMDTRGRLIYVNPAFERLTGYGREEVLGHTSAHLLRSEHHDPEFYQYLWRTISSGQTLQVELTSRGKQGQLIYQEATGSPVLNDQGQIVAYVGIRRDIRERKQAELALQRRREQERLLDGIAHRIRESLQLEEILRTTSLEIRAFLQTSGVAIFQWQQEQLWLMTQAQDPRNGDQLRLPSPLLTPESLAQFQQGQSISFASLDQGSEQSPIGLTPQQIDFFQTQQIQALLALPILHQGKLWGILTAFHDQGRHWQSSEIELLEQLITQVGIAIQQAELYQQLQLANSQLEHQVQIRTAQLRQAKDAAEAASQAKTRFLANMSHELRTPMNAVLGFTQLLQRDPQLTPSQRQYLEIIDRSGEHLLHLINTVLELSKIEVGQLTITPIHFDLKDLLVSLEAMLRLKARSKGLRFCLEQDPELPTLIYGDQGKIRQVLTNLLSNAIKFTETGQVILRVRYREPQLQLEVEDTGPGIGPEELDQLFKPFTQTRAGQQLQEGTGLGLSICQQFVRLMGGEIRVTSQLEQGSLFCVDLPVSLGLESGSDRDPESPVPPRPILGIAPLPSPYRILVAEDQPESGQLLVSWLRSVGFEVGEAQDGQQTLQMWESWDPDLIWMDMRMPQLDGYATTRLIRSRQGQRHPVIIAVTASAFEEDRSAVLAAGCDDFVRKPLQLDQILETMARHLSIQLIRESPPQAGSISPALTSADLATLPQDLLHRLDLAATDINVKQLQEVIEAVHRIAPQIASGLTSLVDHFQFQHLQDLITAARTG